MSTVINTAIGPVQITQQRWSRELELSFNGVEVLVSVSDKDSDMLSDCLLKVSRGYLIEPELARETSKLLTFAADLAELINEANADRRAEIELERKRQEEEAEREREECRQRIAERTELLLTELVDERVNIRQHGYKTMRQATVGVRELRVWNRETSEYEVAGYAPKFDYVNAADASRTQHVDEIKRLDVKVRGTRKWKTVWEDGMDDLNPWDRDAVSLKPVQDRYDGSCQEDS
jgi:hypothetical protein